MPVKHINITVYGAVQGVGFRFAAQKKASELGLCGFARNEPNGAVCIEAEGEDDALSKFIKWCGKGPRFSAVKKVDIEDRESCGYKSFEIG